MFFKYTAFTAEKKIVKGELEVVDKDFAVQTLERAGYNILSLKPFHKFSIEEAIPGLYRVKKIDIALFSRQLAMLMEKGVRFLPAMELAKEQVKNKLFRKRLEEIISDVESGNTFSDSLAKHPDIFPSVYYSMIKVGEKSGKLDSVLKEVADDMEQEESSKKKIRNAFIYPGVILFMGIATVVIMVTTVLPSMSGIFDRFGADLPLVTKITVAAGDFVTENGMYLLGGVLVLTLLFSLYSRTPRGKYALERLMMSLPVIGKIIFLRSLYQFSKIVAILLDSGLPIPQVIAIAQEGVQSESIRRELDKIPSYLMQGYGLSRSMKESSLFPPMVVQMVVTGEETNTLESSFQALREHYEFEFNQALSTFMSLLEPVLVAIIGLIIGFVAVSSILPMFSMYDVLF
ncbi:MAG: type II secretion system F family protein [Dehalococcoidales bacterium]|nr:type II secretion system F family protein [Dehalococcoidales bacterium]